MIKTNLLGVKIDYVRIDQALEIIGKWLQSRGKHYVVTPNPEMIVDASFDSEFKKALNEANLAIPDSPRLGWASKLLDSKQAIFRLIYAPFFLFPKAFSKTEYPTTTGIDLTERLIKLSEEKGYTTAYLGGSETVAVKLFKCLRLKYPKLKIRFCSGNIQVGIDGQSRFDIEKDTTTRSKHNKIEQGEARVLNAHTISEKIDILFLAFGHKKQEKWMMRNLPKLNTRVMIGVGGAFDYLSGEVPRAPQAFRSLGLEWAFRFLLQPWRIKRYWKLFYFVYLVIVRRPI